MENKTFVAMKAVILNDKNEILIIQESSKDPSRSHVGKWDVPGGRLNFGEDPFEGLRREVKEETNLNVDIMKPLGVSHWRPQKNNENWYIVATFMLCKTKSIEVKISNFEHDNFKWVNIQELKNYEVIPTTMKVLNNLVENE